MKIHLAHYVLFDWKLRRETFCGIGTRLDQIELTYYKSDVTCKRCLKSITENTPAFTFNG